MNRSHRIVLAALLPLCLALSTLCGDVDRWYEIEIAGKPCGFLHESVVEEDGVVRTSTVERFVVTRGGRPVALNQETVFEETERGEPLRARVMMKAGGEPSIQSYEFSDGVIACQHDQHGRRWTEEIALDTMDWFTPAEAAEFVAARIQSGAKRVQYATIEPSNQMSVVQIQMELLGTEEREIRGRTRDLGKWRTRTSTSPLELIELRTNDGIVVLAEVELGIGAMKMELVDQARAEAALTSVGPELLATTVVPVEGMPRSSEKISTAAYLVRAPGLDSFELPNSGAQQVNKKDDGSLRVSLDIDHGSEASLAEEEDVAYRNPSALVDASDPEVQSFTNRSLRRASEDPLDRAEVLRRAVARHIKTKNYGTAFASASDAVRERVGDCTEHSVLLAAALRADGIPARVATGLVHARVPGAPQGGFAWHMWTQALIDGRWIDLDATRSKRFDAGHILVSTSALERGAGERDFASMLPLLGRLQIDVLEIDGRDIEREKP